MLVQTATASGSPLCSLHRGSFTKKEDKCNQMTSIIIHAHIGTKKELERKNNLRYSRSTPKSNCKSLEPVLSRDGSRAKKA